MLKIIRSLGQVQHLLAARDACLPPFLSPAPSWALTLAVALQVCSGQDGSALSPSYLERNVSAPPPSPRPEIRTAATSLPAKTVHLLSAGTGLTLYSIGDPTDQEQLYLELLNRGRADSAAEALRLQSSTDPDILNSYSGFNVDLALMVAQLSGIPPAPPLSMNAQLTASARGHSQDMLANGFQGHNGTDGSTFATRATAAGYIWNMIGENVFASAHSVEEGTAAFEVDWGPVPTNGGMQLPPGHRINDHSTNYLEIGIGVVSGTNGQYGPNSVTEDFGRRAGTTPFITGVTYYDLNGNGIYDLGEGLGGVTIQANGSSFYAVSANSGGYSIPVPGDGSYTVSFSVPGFGPALATATVSGNNNVKVDYPLAYVAPSVTGLDQAGVNQSINYSFSTVPGATAYQWRQDQLVPATLEGAENGLANVTATTSSGYSVLAGDVKASGNFSFHLAQPTSPDTAPTAQTLLLNPTFELTAATQLNFASRLGWAGQQQVARAQVSVDGGQSWQDVWSQPGTGDAGETSFSTRTISLANLAGKSAQIRFVYDFIGGNFFPQTDPGVGWYLDDILVQNANELAGETVSDITSGASFTFTPSAMGTFTLSVRPRVSGRLFPWGPAKPVTVQSTPVLIPIVQISGTQRLARGRLGIDFTVTNPSSGSYAVQTKSDLAGVWAEDSTATITATQANTAFRAVVTAPATGNGFYRIVAK